LVRYGLLSYAEKIVEINLVNYQLDEEFIMTKKMQRYSFEFKAEAVKKIADNNGNVSATAKQLGIAMQTLSNWQNKANEGKLISTK